jgi:hypothetical protein
MVLQVAIHHAQSRIGNKSQTRLQEVHFRLAQPKRRRELPQVSACLTAQGLFDPAKLFGDRANFLGEVEPGRFGVGTIAFVQADLKREVELVHPVSIRAAPQMCEPRCTATRPQSNPRQYKIRDGSPSQVRGASVPADGGMTLGGFDGGHGHGFTSIQNGSDSAPLTISRSG